MATSVPLKFFTSATEIFWFSRIQYKILSRKRTKYTEFASRIFGEATSVFEVKCFTHLFEKNIDYVDPAREKTTVL